MSTKLRPGYFDPKGIIVEGFEPQKGIIAEGTTVPAATTTGYEEGCLFFKRDGALGAQLYMNQGTAESCNFQPLATSTFGSGGGSMGESGNIYSQPYAIADANGQPAATGADTVIAVYSLPKNSLDLAGRGLLISMQGNFAATGNNKTCKIIWNATTAVVGATVTGGTTIATTGVSAGNNVGWLIQGSVYKYGAANSNTQVTQEVATIVGTTHGGIALAANTTATENAAILIAFTGNAATAATDIQMTLAEVFAMN